MKRLPRWTRVILHLTVPAARLDDVLGDIEETRGGVRDVLLTAMAFVYYRLRARWWAIARWIVLSDLRFGLRLIRKEPVLSATAVAALATAVTIACMGYVFAEQMLFAELPFVNGDRFVRIEISPPLGSSAEIDDAEVFRRVRSGATTLAHSSAFAIATGELSLQLQSGDVDSIRATYLTPETFAYLPYSPIAGRTFLAGDGALSAPPTAVIRESLWQRHFARDPSIVGKAMTLGGVSRTVIGVMPDRFEFPVAAEVWLPFDPQTLTDVGQQVAGPRFIGIMRDQVTLAVVQAELQTLMPHMPVGSNENERARVKVEPFCVDSDAALIVFPVLLAIILLTLLVIVGNVAVLMTARGWARATELAVRAALGAGRARIVGQLTAEVLLLGVIAAISGVIATTFVFRWIDRSNPDIPFWIDLTPGVSTLTFVAIIAVITVVIAGVWPAAVVTRSGLAHALQQAGRGSSRGGFGRTAGVMITIQIAMAVALLSGAVSMARALRAYVEGPRHVVDDQLLTARVNLPPDSSFAALTDAVVNAAGSLPGANAAAIATHVPRRDPPLTPVEIDAAPGETLTTLIHVPGAAAGAGFIEAIGGRAIIGRLLNSHDCADGAVPVALVNESFVAKHMAGRNPLGRRIRAAAPRDGETPVWREIVGVVPDLGLSTGDATAEAGFYVPLRPRSEFRLVVRTSTAPIRLTQPLRVAITAVDPAIRLREIVPLEEVGADEKAFLAATASAMIALGLTALALSIVSVYALLSFAVTRRTREIGVRVALGALPRQIVMSVLGSASTHLILGAVLGSALGVLLMRARVVLAFRMPTTGGWVVPVVIFPLIVAGLIACWVPARRALGIQPAEALKVD